MELIVITSEHNHSQEYQTLSRLVELGLGTIHLRKPKMSEIEIRLWLDALPESCLSKIVLHSHWHLSREYKVKGVHGKLKYLEAFADDSDLTLSFSAHNMAQIQATPQWLDYLFYSPVFSSISKEGYEPQMQLEELKLELSNVSGEPKKIMALGGISPENVEQLLDCGFSGVALLGSIWTVSPDLAVENFKQIKESLCSIPA